MGTNRKNGMVSSIKGTFIILIAIAAIFIILILTMFIKTESDLKNLEFYKVDLNELEDGLYKGQAETTFVKAEVKVEISGHKIVRIEILKHDKGFGKKAERIAEDMVNMNTYEVDAVSGATSSSQVIKSAVSDALANGKV